MVVALAGLIAAALNTNGGGGAAGASETAARLTPTPTPSQPPPAVWVATAARPARVWVGGDSLGGELVWGLTPLLKNAGVFRATSFYKESSGICRYDFFNWRIKMSSVMSKTRPHAVAIMLGANDTQSIWTADGWITYGTTEWKSVYGKRVGYLMDLMLKGGARRVYWVGMPIMRESWRTSRMRVINAIIKRQAGRRPGVRYIDVWPLFTDADGRYVAGWRARDGVHFSTTGWQRLGKRVYRSLKADWLSAVAPTPSPTTSASASPSQSPVPPPSPSTSVTSEL